MTDRYASVLVTLEHDMREDDAEQLLAAIRMLRGVLDVTPAVSDSHLWVAENRARQRLIQQLWEVLTGDKQS